MACDQANTYETIELLGLTEKDAPLPIPEDDIPKDSIIRETFETPLGQLRVTRLEAAIEPLAHGLPIRYWSFWRPDNRRSVHPTVLHPRPDHSGNFWVVILENFFEE